MLKVLKRVFNVLHPDSRPDWEQKREREFIQAANSLKTLKVTPEGGMSIDPEELRDQIIASREQLKHLVHKPGALGLEFTSVAGQEASPIVGASQKALDCIEVVVWRCLSNGAAVRYMSFQCVSTGRFAVAAATLFSEGAGSLQRWIDSDTTRQVACALHKGELRWHVTAGEARGVVVMISSKLLSTGSYP